MSRQQGNGYGSQQLVTDSTAQIRATFICPDVSFSLAGSGFITQYSCHPRLMPDLSMQDNYRNRTIGGGGPKGHYLVPYKITQVKRSSEAGLLADGVVSNNGYYAHATMNGLDASNITYFKGPWLTSDISFNPANQLGTSIDMVPTRTPPSNYTDANLDTDNNSGQIRFRHINNTQTNLLMVDGHVESFTYNKFTHQTDLFRKYVYVTPNM